ncbi:hypothetical protein DACRYDRAFT_94332 [Dacryopinax primogenitus]|uniref:Aminoglycoside phosphotransferase domain-containing protein n=1 Tax=Dacryopinax primogenitus (strain DJM 731) TaxID=1858805 RepID=M5GBG1_DACPD|nr:uncharacterized protein DACRYDRAFT_94332 [Dacryopinax primogenitus]EJU03392.1 hypothetical protein DACRYDRAFT_94332 [Dacryopinax primogenitus]
MDIPVPAVYGFHPGNDNPVGTPWTLLQLIPGQPLSGIWPSLSPQAKLRVVEQVATWILKVFAVEFAQIGSLHFTSPQEGKRNLCESYPDLYVGSMITLRGLHQGYIRGPPRARDPASTAAEWYKQVLNGSMEYERDPPQPKPGPHVPP